ncbi:MAG TPA: IS1634 family transposase [Candidatus Binatia bacterium]|nr:IS1634 family transposase [Candidatus Binatia bacterium]
MYHNPDSASRQIFTKQGRATLHVHRVGALPILRHFLDRMTFSRIVGSSLGTLRGHILDHAQTLSVLIQNYLLSPSPLYRIAEWAAPFSSSALGLSAEEKAAINDDRVARSLDALVSIRAGNIFFRLALNLIKKFEIDTRRIHHDTTTVTFHGSYLGSISEPRITYGMNKDHRPDLKQLVFGVNVTADGAVPVSHQVFSGNRSDDTIHRSNLEQLRELLRRDDFIYVADCKLATRKNLSYIATYGGKFVTVIPRSRAEDRDFRNRLRQGIRARWRRFHVQENKRRKSDPPEIYWTTAAGPNKTAEGYRIIWCRNSLKAALDAKVRNDNLERAEAELFLLGTRLNRRALRTRPAITKQVKAILRGFESEPFFTVKVRSEIQVKTQHLHRGRPRKNDPHVKVRSPLFRLEIQRNKDALRSESRTDGVFPIVTNLEPRRAPKKEVLLIYKYQPYVEKRHALFKTELETAPVYLKKPHRVVGLLHAVFLAMMLDALIERTLRQGMSRQGLESLPILPESRESKTPTTARLLEMFSDLCWYEFEREGETVTFPIKLSAFQKELLHLLDMDPLIYS